MAYHSWQNKAPSKEFDEGHAATFGEKADPFCSGCGRLPHFCECPPVIASDGGGVGRVGTINCRKCGCELVIKCEIPPGVNGAVELLRKHGWTCPNCSTATFVETAIKAHTAGKDCNTLVPGAGGLEAWLPDLSTPEKVAEHGEALERSLSQLSSREP